ncbi:MAG: ABC transporter permease [Oscillospiraceae bacterium]|nr:ABC transporter permease [Oscillospiraceae bacterium]
MKAAIRNELKKLILHKKYTVLLIIGVLLGLAWSLTGYLLSAALNAFMGLGVLWDFNSVPTSSLPMFAHFYLPMMIFMAVTDLFAGEYGDQTIRAALVRPITRLKLYTAKLSAIMIYITGFLGVVFTANLIAGVFVGGVDSPWVALRSLASFALTLVPLAVLACFAALGAQIIKSGSLLMFSMILSLLLMSVLPLLLPFTRNMLFTSFLGWYRMFAGALPMAGVLVNTALTLLASGAVFYLAGTITFDRKDF